LIHTRAPQAPLLDGCHGLAPRSLENGQRDPRTGALRSISPPALRHTAASLALEHWAELHQVQQMLRHASIQTTELYVHHKDRLRHAAAHRIPDLT
jgi:site-specific recombinase XerD